MHIEWSERAIDEVTARFGDDAKPWKLVFDAEGCGCAVDGVPTLWHVASSEPEDVQIGSNVGQMWINPKHLIFFEDRLRIDYLPDHRSFKLASDGQIYTSRLKLENRAAIKA